MYGKVKVLEEISNKNKNDFVLCECINCGAKFNRLIKDQYRKHACSSFRKNDQKEEKWCFKCSSWLELVFFQKAKHVNGGYSKACRDCRRNYMAYAEIRRKSKNRKFYDKTGELPPYKLASIRASAKTRATKYNLAFNLDTPYLRELWKNQQGKCFYTDQSMKWSKDKVSFWSPSLDRLDPDKGYIKGNVVFTLFAINSFKQELSANDFLKFINSVKWRKSL